jgi:hypothetical protein
MKKIAFLMFCFWMISIEFVLCQPDKGMITGFITDLQNQPLFGVNIRLLNQSDSLTIRTTTSDEKGKFVIDKLSQNTYLLVCSYIGYNKYLSLPLTIDTKHPFIVLPVIGLSQADVNLRVVVVAASKPLIQHKIDRTIVNVDAMSTAAGSNIIELISKSPGVIVDSDGDISLNGKGNVLILIEGKTTYLSVKDLAAYLKSLPAGLVDRLELMSNPSSKYDAASSAIINIVLKKYKSEGFIGGVSLGYIRGKYSRSNDALNINYRNGKYNLFSSLSYGRDQNFRKETTQRNFYMPYFSSPSSLVQNNAYVFSSNSYNLRTGVDYLISPKTTIGLQLTGNTRPKTDNQVYSSNQVDDSLRLIKSTTGNSSGKYKWKNAGINLNFQQKFDSTGTILSTDLDYILYTSGGNQLFINRYFNSKADLNSSNTTKYDLPSRINIFSAKTDYTYPINDKTRFEAGFKSSFVTTDNTTDWFDLAGMKFLPNYSNSNHFIYKENINAIYASLSKEWNRWAFQTGLRVENTRAYGHLLSNPAVGDSVFFKNYTHLFPSIYLSYKIDPSGNNVILFNFDTRIRRPSYQQLNPFLLMQDNYTYTSGNPNLIPHFTTNLSLKYSYKNIIDVTFNYGHINRIIQTLTQESGDILISKPENFGTNYSYNLVPYVSLNPVKNWDLQVSGILFYLVNKGNAFGQMIENSVITGELEINNQLDLGKGWKAELNGFYASKHIGGQSISDPVWRLDAGLLKSVLKDRGTIRIKIDDIFNSLIRQETILGLPDQSAYRKSYADTRAFGVAFNYRFGNQSSSKKRNHSTGAEDEKGRVN